MQKTYQPKAKDMNPSWYIVDAKGQTLGRLAVNIARVLRGKHRPQYTPHLNTGDHVIVINAEHVVVTGGKGEKKQYDRYSGYPGGRRERSFDDVLEAHPTYPLTHAIKGMLQHNALGADQLKRLRVYAGTEHSHEAQKPQLIKFGSLGEIIVASN